MPFEVDGNDITKIFTFGSWYDRGCIGVLVRNQTTGNEECYRLSVSELLKIANELKFTAEKARKHTYLKISKLHVLSDNDEDEIILDFEN